MLFGMSVLCCSFVPSVGAGDVTLRQLRCVLVTRRKHAVYPLRGNEDASSQLLAFGRSINSTALP